MRRIILAVTGASGMPYAERLIRFLGAAPDIELHLIFSQAARRVLEFESDVQAEDLTALANRLHADDDLAAGPASGSWRHHGMIVCPCSMASLAAIACGLGANLIHRAADVTLKERRPLILAVRETPLREAHLKNMLAVCQAGAVVLPACPGFYHRPRDLGELVDHLAGRILDQLDIEHGLYRRWGEEA